MSIASINPTTGQQLQIFPPLADDDLKAKIIESERVFQGYRQTSWTQRSQWLHQAAILLRDDRQSFEWAKLMTLEMGKPIAQAIAEIQKCALVCDYYAERGAEFLAPEIIATDASQSRIEYYPLGTILAIMPWNFPFWQVFRFAAPTLMAGNVALLKHASNVPQCAIAIEDILLQAGFPPGVFQTQAFSTNLLFSRIFPRLVPPTAMNFLAPWRCYLQYPIWMPRSR